MTDISKCADQSCPYASKCWRFTAPSSFYQWYGGHDRKGGDKCDDFWPVTDLNPPRGYDNGPTNPHHGGKLMESK